MTYSSNHLICIKNKIKSPVSILKKIPFNLFAEEEKLGETIGEEWEHEEFDAEELQEESILTEYDQDDFISGAINSGPYSSIPVDLFEFEYPFVINYFCYKNMRYERTR